jgi:hypothetical protein
MHTWGDTGVDWEGISDAAHYIGSMLLKYGRVQVLDMKEKYGEVRVYVSFGWYQIHCITHPGHSYGRYPKFLWNLDCMYLSHIVPLLNPVVVPMQKFLYTYIYGKALRKWPHLRKEILQGADYPELLTKYREHHVQDEH